MIEDVITRTIFYGVKTRQSVKSTLPPHIRLLFSCSMYIITMEE